MNILLPEVKALLMKAQSDQETFQVPNDHLAIVGSGAYKGCLQHLKDIASAIGVPFDETKYTFRVVGSTKGREVYGPYISNRQGVPTLFWGAYEAPLSALAPMTPIAVEKRTYAGFDVGTEEVPVTLMLKSEGEGKDRVYPDFDAIRRAAKKKQLGSLLTEAFIRPLPLRDLEPGSYQMVGYVSSKFKNDEKLAIELSDGRRFKANSALARLLADKPVITPDEPATLEVGISTENYGVHPIIPVSLSTRQDELLPVFTF